MRDTDKEIILISETQMMEYASNFLAKLNECFTIEDKLNYTLKCIDDARGRAADATFKRLQLEDDLLSMIVQGHYNTLAHRYLQIYFLKKAFRDNCIYLTDRYLGFPQGIYGVTKKNRQRWKRGELME